MSSEEVGNLSEQDEERFVLRFCSAINCQNVFMVDYHLLAVVFSVSINQYNICIWHN